MFTGVDMSKMMRISEITAKNLDELVELTGDTKQYLIEEAIELYKREQFLKKTNDEYTQLKRNPKAWQQLKQETEEWDVLLNEGLDNE